MDARVVSRLGGNVPSLIFNPERAAPFGNFAAAAPLPPVFSPKDNFACGETILVTAPKEESAELRG